MDCVRVKKEALDSSIRAPAPPERSCQRQDDAVSKATALIQLTSSSSSSSSSGGSFAESDSGSDDDAVGSKRSRVDSGGAGGEKKRRKEKRKPEDFGVVLPVGFLAPLPPTSTKLASAAAVKALVLAPQVTDRGNSGSVSLSVPSFKQFWKAGDYDGCPSGGGGGGGGSDWDFSTGGMDHVRVHPKFLHSNATSHKWALGAFAELLDNSLDEVCNGASYVTIDLVNSRKDDSRMLLIEDNGGGMDPDQMRKCMSLGYSAKSKMANTIGQYGNGFKTSTMRLGADVIVFSRCPGTKGKSPTQSIGLLSYTFLRSTGMEDIVVPMLDYEREGQEWKKIMRSSLGDWNRNLETIVQWSPFTSEAELLHQFKQMPDHGTRIIIYNLWEDDEGLLELDFDTDPHDIQLRGVNRDEKNIQMAKEFPNSRHFLTYRHSLRSYVSILYLRLPPRFRIILRGKDIEHHNLVNDMMLTQEVSYKPQNSADGAPNFSHMTALVTIGFVKDAKHHIDVQGFNVYHKNRLIKPFWRLWNAAGSDGRGVIGVLEANFVEPAHDKQGFERTTVLARLEARLIQMQKTYWSNHCHKIGYAPRRNKKLLDESVDGETSPDYEPHSSSQSKKKSGALSSKRSALSSDKSSSHANQRLGGKQSEKSTTNVGQGLGNGTKSLSKSGKRTSREPLSPSIEDVSDDDVHIVHPSEQANGGTPRTTLRKSSERDQGLTTRQSPGSHRDCRLGEGTVQRATRSQSTSDSQTVEQLRRENHELKQRLERSKGETQEEINGLQCDRCKSLGKQLKDAQRKIEELSKEQETLIDIFSEERDRRDREEGNLRRKLQDASNTIQELLEKVKLLERMKSPTSRAGRQG